MLCSNCSEPIVPVVALDIDGTLGDYHTHLLTFAEAYLGVKKSARDMLHPAYDGTTPFGEWFCKVFGTDIATFRQIKLAYRQGGQKRSMPAFQGCATMAATLRGMGVEVWVTTTRPYLRLDGIDPDTRFWLDLHGITYDGLLYDQDKYKLLSERVDRDRVVAVLDDLPEQYDAAAKEFGKHVPLLRRNRYNTGVHRGAVASSLAEALGIIKSRVINWKEQHAEVAS